jgi:hypothetical protein
MRRIKTLASALVVALVVIASLDYTASAATGHSFVLGKINKANKVTALKRTTAGPALQLATTSTAAAPLTVNGRGKVANLNADRLDGMDSSALRTRSHVWRSSFSSKQGVSFTLPVPAGTYLVNYSGIFAGIGASPIQCFITEKIGSGERYTGYESSNDPGGSYDPAMSGMGLVTKTATGSIRVSCDAGATAFSTDAQSPLEIVATPTAVVSSGALAPAPVF